ncbi:LuxR family transcriptional regulator [Ruegeria sp.]|uniref:LuxR family transcriptional regulator n=1 Tax=Ruegeria sp. TaxID=1879320 RepID=UPI0023283691|nr:LuxR family transcriptional regulator [Ruegeria sp.]MDA7966251.1 LuxR family transcriptional regulator [Ruegeria sp.]
MPTLGEISELETPSSPSWDAFELDITDFLKKLELTYYSYVQVRKPMKQPGSGSIEFRANYKPEWIKRYCERRYDQIDPVCFLARQARSPFSWGSKQFLSVFSKQQKRVFWEGRDYGIHYGFSIPVLGIDGGVSVASFTGHNKSALAEVISEHGPRLHVAAHQICDFLEPGSDVASEEGSPLTVRERECLVWVSQGLTSEEIADRVFLSVSTVNYHLGNVVRKMSARNRHHAALLALAKGLV